MAVIKFAAPGMNGEKFTTGRDKTKSLVPSKRGRTHVFAGIIADIKALQGPYISKESVNHPH